MLSQLAAAALAELTALIGCAAVGAELGLGSFLHRSALVHRSSRRNCATLAVFHSLLDLLADHAALFIPAVFGRIPVGMGLRTCSADPHTLQQTCQCRAAKAAANIADSLQGDAAAVDAELDFIKIGIVADLHLDEEIVMVLVTAGIVTDHLSLGIALLDFLFIYFNVGNAGYHILEGDDIGIFCLVVRPVRHKEAGGNTADFFDVHDVFFIADLSGNCKVLMLLCVLLTVGQLLLDLRYRGFSAVFKPRGQQLDAVLADLTVLQLFVAQQTDFLAANFAVLLLKHIKQTHNQNLLSVLLGSQRFQQRGQFKVL